MLTIASAGLRASLQCSMSSEDVENCRNTHVGHLVTRKTGPPTCLKNMPAVRVKNAVKKADGDSLTPTHS